jgi:hypothetical protein
MKEFLNKRLKDLDIFEAMFLASIISLGLVIVILMYLFVIK